MTQRGEQQRWPCIRNKRDKLQGKAGGIKVTHFERENRLDDIHKEQFLKRCINQPEGITQNQARNLLKDLKIYTFIVRFVDERTK